MIGRKAGVNCPHNPDSRPLPCPAERGIKVWHNPLISANTKEEGQRVKVLQCIPCLPSSPFHPLPQLALWQKQGKDVESWCKGGDPSLDRTLSRCPHCQ